MINNEIKKKKTVVTF